MVQRRLPRPSELRPLLRPAPFVWDADERRLRRAASIADLRTIARRRTPRAVFDYVDGGAETERTLREIGTQIPSVFTAMQHLSGGQRQAVELCRFVHWGGKLVLLDEPFAALGVRQTHRGLEMIEQVKARGVAVIVITHNMLHAFQVADRIVVLRQGKVAGIRAVGDTTTDEVVTLITGERIEVGKRSSSTANHNT
jgi:D-xylose transport system ATP-binding protein